MYTSNLPLHPAIHNKVAVITGGSGVLCRVMALELARQGAKIAVISRTLANAEAVAEEIRKIGGLAIAIECDVTDEVQTEKAANIVEQQLGLCDILINGAGGNHSSANTTNEVFREEDRHNPDTATFFELNPDSFRDVMDVNFTGTFIPARQFAKQMIGRSGASIINISSMSAPSPLTRIPAYSAAKAAINNFTQWLAVHMADAGIRVNAIAPGFFITEQNRSLLVQEDGSLTERSNKIIAHTPMRRFGKPEDLLGVLLWLVDETTSQFVTGAVIPVDGGFLAYSGV